MSEAACVTSACSCVVHFVLARRGKYNVPAYIHVLTSQGVAEEVCYCDVLTRYNAVCRALYCNVCIV